MTLYTTPPIRSFIGQLCDCMPDNFELNTLVLLLKVLNNVLVKPSSTETISQPADEFESLLAGIALFIYNISEIP